MSDLQIGLLSVYIVVGGFIFMACADNLGCAEAGALTIFWPVFAARGVWRGFWKAWAK